MSDNQVTEAMIEAGRNAYADDGFGSSLIFPKSERIRAMYLAMLRAQSPAPATATDAGHEAEFLRDAAADCRNEAQHYKPGSRFGRAWSKNADALEAEAVALTEAKTAGNALGGEGTCELCRRRYEPDWSAASPLWNVVMRGGSINGDERHQFVCASCFIDEAARLGVASDFRLSAGRLTGAELVTPSGRTWDERSFRWTEPAQAGESGMAELERAAKGADGSSQSDYCAQAATGSTSPESTVAHPQTVLGDAVESALTALQCDLMAADNDDVEYATVHRNDLRIAIAALSTDEWMTFARKREGPQCKTA